MCEWLLTYSFGTKFLHEFSSFSSNTRTLVQIPPRYCTTCHWFTNFKAKSNSNMLVEFFFPITYLCSKLYEFLIQIITQKIFNHFQHLKMIIFLFVCQNYVWKIWNFVFIKNSVLKKIREKFLIFKLIWITCHSLDYSHNPPKKSIHKRSILNHQKMEQNRILELAVL